MTPAAVTSGTPTRSGKGTSASSRTGAVASNGTVSTFKAVCRLARANMTIISAVTYLTGAVLATGGDVKPGYYFAGWAFVILTQFMTHFLGEVADARSDKLNKYCTPITGGSGVLPADAASVTMTNVMGYLSAGAALVVLNTAVPQTARPVGFLMQLLAWAYSAEPVKLNHRCLGEVDASFVCNVLLPYFAAAVQGAVSGTSIWDRRLAILVVPPMLVKLSLFVLLNLADKRADWATGKVTLAVWFGPHISAHLHKLLMCAAYVSATLIAIADRTPLVLLFFIPSIYYALQITQALAEDPYSVAPQLGPALLHSTLLVWGMFLYTLVTSPFTGLRFYHFIAATFLYVTIEKTIAGRRRAAQAAAKRKAVSVDSESDSDEPALLPLPKPREDTDPLTERKPSTGSRVYADALIIGAGLQGMLVTALLRRLGIDAICLDASEDASCSRPPRLGATVLLSPTDLHTLARLGLPRDYLTSLPCDGVSARVPRDELISLVRLVTQGMVSYDVRVTRIREDERADCVRASHSRKDCGAVVARVALGTTGVADHVRATRTREPRGPAECTPRCLTLDTSAERPVSDALRAARLLATFWSRPDGHLEAFYRYTRGEDSPLQF